MHSQPRGVKNTPQMYVCSIRLVDKRRQGSESGDEASSRAAGGGRREARCVTTNLNLKKIAGITLAAKTWTVTLHASRA